MPAAGRVHLLIDQVVCRAWLGSWVRNEPMTGPSTQSLYTQLALIDISRSTRLCSFRCHKRQRSIIRIRSLRTIDQGGWGSAREREKKCVVVISERDSYKLDSRLSMLQAPARAGPCVRPVDQCVRRVGAVSVSRPRHRSVAVAACVSDATDRRTARPQTNETKTIVFDGAYTHT